ncbi:hypothetical protein [Paenibacillus lactis]|uniref:hypothetical protein n=1 Tax=Paenibacillus lactis TaxID=228574 RepID=UPI00110FBCDB|nr:hypothetical protein [Paenibacillus lactis]
MIISQFLFKSLTADDRHDLTMVFASTMQLTGAFPLQANGTTLSRQLDLPIVLSGTCLFDAYFS